MKLRFTVVVEPHERHELDVYFKAIDMQLALEEIREAIRQELKYKETPMTLEEFSDKFWEIINERNLQDLL